MSEGKSTNAPVRKLTTEAAKLVQEYFSVSHYPTPQLRKEILTRVKAVPKCRNYTMKQLDSWFLDARAKYRKGRKQAPPTRPLADSDLKGLKAVYETTQDITDEVISGVARRMMLSVQDVEMVIRFFRATRGRVLPVLDRPTVGNQSELHWMPEKLEILSSAGAVTASPREEEEEEEEEGSSSCLLVRPGSSVEHEPINPPPFVGESESLVLQSTPAQSPSDEHDNPMKPAPAPPESSPCLLELIDNPVTAPSVSHNTNSTISLLQVFDDRVAKVDPHLFPPLFSRSRVPAEAVTLLQECFTHSQYPTLQQKNETLAQIQAVAKCSSYTMKQMNSWFINARAKCRKSRKPAPPTRSLTDSDLEVLKTFSKTTQDITDEMISGVAERMMLSVQDVEMALRFLQATRGRVLPILDRPFVWTHSELQRIPEKLRMISSAGAVSARSRLEGEEGEEEDSSLYPLAWPVSNVELQPATPPPSDGESDSFDLQSTPAQHHPPTDDPMKPVPTPQDSSPCLSEHVDIPALHPVVYRSDYSTLPPLELSDDLVTEVNSPLFTPLLPIMSLPSSSHTTPSTSPMQGLMISLPEVSSIDSVQETRLFPPLQPPILDKLQTSVLPIPSASETRNMLPFQPPKLSVSSVDMNMHRSGNPVTPDMLLEAIREYCASLGVTPESAPPTSLGEFRYLFSAYEEQLHDILMIIDAPGRGVSYA